MAFGAAPIDSTYPPFLHNVGWPQVCRFTIERLKPWTRIVAGLETRSSGDGEEARQEASEQETDQNRKNLGFTHHRLLGLSPLQTAV